MTVSSCNNGSERTHRHKQYDIDNLPKKLFSISATSPWAPLRITLDMSIAASLGMPKSHLLLHTAMRAVA